MPSERCSGTELQDSIPSCQGFPGGSAGKESPYNEVWSLGREDPLEREKVTLSNILAWKIPWTEEPGRLQTMGLQRVRRDWATKHPFLPGNSHGIFHITPHNKMWSYPLPLYILYQGPRAINSCFLPPLVPLSHLQTPELHPCSHYQFLVPHHSHLLGLTPENRAKPNSIQFYPWPLMDPNTIWKPLTCL